jgi:DNA-binding response OmpR family regulator
VEAENLWTIALTADVREPQRLEAMRAGLNDFLAKPLNVGELEAALRRFREARRGRGA